MLKKDLKEHLDCFRDLAEFADLIEHAAALLTTCIQQGGKILICGNGGSAADSQHFAAEIVGRFRQERVAMPAIALTTDTSILTAIGNDYDFSTIFSRQIQALGRPDDMLIALSTSGSSSNVVNAVAAAHNLGIASIVLTGGDGGKLVSMAEVSIVVPSRNTPRIQEAHIFILHFWAQQLELATIKGTT